MSESTITLVRKDRQIKVAQYCQWRGYPSRHGVEICRFIQTDLDLERFKEALDECRFVDEEFIEEKWNECECPYIFMQWYPQFHRDTGARVLRLIQDEGVRDLKNYYPETVDVNITWSYVIDLDEEKLFVYRWRVDLDHPEKNLQGSYSFEEATPEAMRLLELKDMLGQIET